MFQVYGCVLLPSLVCINVMCEFLSCIVILERRMLPYMFVVLCHVSSKMLLQEIKIFVFILVSGHVCAFG